MNKTPNWMPTSGHKPEENTDVAILVPILDKNGNYKQYPTLAKYTKERYEISFTYFKNVNYFIPFLTNLDLKTPDGYLEFTKINAQTGKPENHKPETIYVVRIEHKTRITFSVATFIGDKWRNNAGILTHVTHSAALPDFPPMPIEHT